MNRLLTLTGNLLAEFTAEYTTTTPGKTHRARSDSFQVGGKGINVARMAQRLGLESTAVYLAGGIVGDLCEGWLKGQPFGSERIRGMGETRAGWVVRVPGEPETTFLGADRPVPPDVWAEALSHSRPAGSTAVALCGSVPGWTDAHTKQVREHWFGDDEPPGPAYLDTYGPPLTALQDLPWTAIKINLDEFRQLEGVAPGKGDMETRLKRLAERSGAECWIITDGGNPVSVFSGSEGYFELVPPEVKLISPTGSGDVFLATLIAERMEGKSLRAACERALHLSAANAAHPGVAEFPL